MENANVVWVHMLSRLALLFSRVEGVLCLLWYHCGQWPWYNRHNRDVAEYRRLCLYWYYTCSILTATQGCMVSLSSTSLPLWCDNLIQQLHLRSGSHSTRLVVIYRPLPNNKNGYTTSEFLIEFAHLMDSMAMDTSNLLLIAGDFNLHMDDDSNNNTRHFFDQMHQTDVIC